MNNQTSTRGARRQAVRANVLRQGCAPVIEAMERRTLLSAAPGSIDTTFGQGGQATLHLSQPVEVGTVAAVNLPGGKVLVIGQSWGPVPSEVTFARFNADGMPDATFGTGGRVDTGQDLTVNALTVDGRGRIYVAGDDVNGGALVRFKADGSLDGGFADHGYVKGIESFPHGLASVNAIAFEPDGSLLLGGYANPASGTDNDFALARVRASDGALDRRFGHDGVIVTRFSLRGRLLNAAVHSLHVYADGSFLAGGGGDGFLDLVKYRRDGTIDPTFGHAGRVRLSAGTDKSVNYTDFANTGGPWITALAVRPGDGEIFAAGGTPENFGVSYGSVGDRSGPLVLAAFDSRGRSDAHFGRGGSVYVPVRTPYSTPAGAVATGLRWSGEKLLVTAQVYATSYEQAAARYNADGTPDPTFGANLRGADGMPRSAGFRRLTGNQTPLLTPGSLDADADGDGWVIASDGPATSPYPELSALRFRADGSPDTTFGQSGFATAPPEMEPDLAEPFAVAPIPGGGAYLDVKQNSIRSAFHVRPDGAIDPAFHGVLTRSATYFNLGPAAVRAVQPDGKVLVTEGGPNGILYVTRLNPDGSLDPSFGTRGHVRIDQTGSDPVHGLSSPKLLLRPDGSMVLDVAAFETDTLYAVSAAGRVLASRTLPTVPSYGRGSVYADFAVAPDGKVVVNGTMRFNANDLTPDTSFGTGGSASSPLTGFTTAVAVLPDGRIVISGKDLHGMANVPAVGVLLPSGAPDTTFGNGGVVELTGTGAQAAGNVLVQADGTILVELPSSYPHPSYVARLNPDGTLDASFGTSGMATLPAGEKWLAIGADVDGNPALLVAGAVTPRHSYDSVAFVSRVEL